MLPAGCSAKTDRRRKMGKEKEIKQVNLRKVAMIGCGFVGSASAFSLMQSGLFSYLNWSKSK